MKYEKKYIYIPQVTFDRSNNDIITFCKSVSQLNRYRSFLLYFKSVPPLRVHVFDASLIRIMNNESTMNGNQKVDVNHSD